MILGSWFLLLVAAQSQKTATLQAKMDYKKWIREEVVYIILPEERKAFSQLRTEDERENLWYSSGPAG